MDRFKAQYAQSLRAEATKLRALVSRTQAMVASRLMDPQLGASLCDVLESTSATLASVAQEVTRQDDPLPD